MGQAEPLGRHSKFVAIVATVGLRVSEFVYLIIALFVSVVSCIDLKHDFGAWIRYIGMTMAKEKRGTRREKTAIEIARVQTGILSRYAVSFL